MFGSNGNIKNIEGGKKLRDVGQTADAVALGRWRESMRPEDERICYDSYALRFISHETLQFFTRHPAEVRAMVEQLNRSVPGAGNTIVARVPGIDDIQTRKNLLNR